MKRKYVNRRNINENIISKDKILLVLYLYPSKLKIINNENITIEIKQIIVITNDEYAL